MRSLAAIVLALLLGACSFGRPADDATGEEIYAQLCARCHGADLQGGLGPPLGPGSNSAIEDDGYLVFTIENGRGRMPSFSGTLTDDQVDLLVAYMRDVQGQ